MMKTPEAPAAEPKEDDGKAVVEARGGLSEKEQPAPESDAKASEGFDSRRASGSIVRGTGASQPGDL